MSTPTGDFTLQRPGGRTALSPAEAERVAAELRAQGQEVEIRSVGPVRIVWARPAPSRPIDVHAQPLPQSTPILEVAPSADARSAAETSTGAPPTSQEAPGVGREDHTLYRLTAAQLTTLIDAVATPSSRWRWWQKLLLALCLSAFALFVWPTPFVYFEGAYGRKVLIRLNRITGEAIYVEPR